MKDAGGEMPRTLPCSPAGELADASQSVPESLCPTPTRPCR